MAFRNFKKKFCGKPKKRRGRKTVTKAIKTYVHKAVAKAPELKYSELSTFVVYPITNAAYVTNFTFFPTQGTTQSARIGDSIKLKTLDIRFILQGAATSLFNGIAFYKPVSLFRIIIGVFKRPINTGLPAATGATGILDNSVASSLIAPYTPEFRSSWTLLMDKTYEVTGWFGTDSVTPLSLAPSFQKHVHKRIKLNRTMKFSSNAGTVASVVENLPFMLLVSDSSVANHPTISMYSRMYFTDP